MSDPIKVGDLVMVVKPTPCCGETSEIGSVYKVMNIEPNAYGGCEFCKYQSSYVGAECLSVDFGWFEMERLKKIPPLSELEDTTTDTPIKELA